MKERLTPNAMREYFVYNRRTGELRWKDDGTLAGSIHPRIHYRVVSIGTTQYYAHRIAWAMVHGEWPDGQVRHRNRDRSDNSWGNLYIIRNKHES